MILSIIQFIGKQLHEWGVNDNLNILFRFFIGIAIISIVGYFTYFITKQIILKIITIIIKKTSNTWDDIFLKRKVFSRVAFIVPAIVTWYILPELIESHPVWLFITKSLVKIYAVIITTIVLDAVLDALSDIFLTLEISRSRPIKGYLQIIKILLYCVAFIIIISLLINKSPVLLLTGLGAFTAVLMLIFKDPILGFVSSIQLSANDMVKTGDWISMPVHNADGKVIDINLTSVKVQNWDLSITSIPTQSMISQSFLNWRGMEEGLGRRIKRSVFIDINSIHFCNSELLESFEKINLLSKYIQEKKLELNKYNETYGIDQSIETNGRRQTNIGVFRAYLIEYLKNHTDINQDMTILVRQLDPSEKGLPIEIYAFSNLKTLNEYESIQGDIFDHILAVIPHFKLKVFQNPSGSDITNFINK